MKNKFLLGLWVLFFWSQARGEDRSGLFSEKDSEVIGYLETHRIPHIHFHLGSAMPLPNSPNFKKEIEKAYHLFEKGSSEMRLAIARSLAWPGDLGYNFWQLCDKNDYEAKHILFGFATSDADLERRDTLWEWFLKETHPSYASALLSRISKQSFLKDAYNKGEEEVLGRLRELYRQPGTCTTFKVCPGEDSTGMHINRSIQEIVIELLPNSEKGQELLMSWMFSDSKKVAAATLEKMWAKWAEMKISDQNILVKGLNRLDIIESWCLSPNKPTFADKEDLRALFYEKVLLKYSTLMSMLGWLSFATSWREAPSIRI